jgi:hypothetical protein
VRIILAFMHQVVLVITMLVSGIIVAFPIEGTHGQTSSLSTSADDHDNIFFGEGVLQIVINDPDADDDGAVEELVVDIDADPDTGSQGSFSVTVPETSDSSGRFELYLVHADATTIDPADIDAINSAGVEGDGTCATDCAPFVTFGPSGDLQVDAELYEEIMFDIVAADDEIRVNYEEALAQVELDRSAYGSDSFVYVFIEDQDANLNPTERDEFTVDPDTTPNNDLLDLEGGSLESSMTFRETGDNSARFEARYELGASITFDSESLVLTLFDKANYGDTLDADENDSGSTDEVSFSIGNTDGSIDIEGGVTTWDAELFSDRATLAHGRNITVTVEDPDANTQGIVDSIDLHVSNGNSSTAIIAGETGQDAGIFEVTLQLDSDGRLAGTQLDFEQGGIMEVFYIDEKPADYEVRLQRGEDTEKKFALEIAIVSGVSDGASTSLAPPAAGRVGDSDAPLVAGGQLGLSTVIENNADIEQSFVALIEVRNESGITVYLAWQSGSLEPSDSTQIEVSWTPEFGGEYEIRTFAINGFAEGNVLSQVATTSIQVT